MTKENSKKIQAIKDRLVEKKKYLIEQLKKIAKKDKKIKNGFNTEFPKIGDHADENAIEVSDYESTLSVEHDLEKGLRNIGNALKKTSEGTYGTCSRCKKTIDPKRLEILPEATLCTDCSAISN